MTPAPLPPGTGVGHLPEARAVSWSCTCGAAEIRTYGLSVDAQWALRLMADRAARHHHTTLKETR